MATLASDVASRRIVTLDMIRGIAVMGIFSVNVIAFAMIESAYFNPAAYGGHAGPNLALWATNMILIDGKMRTLFSMLFGASMLLVIERAEASGRSGWWTHFRRMIVLLGFGLAHYYLIWFGDILTLYAVAGLCSYMFRRMSPRALVVSGIIWLVLHELLFTGFLYSQYLADIAAHAPGATQSAIKEWNDALGSFYPSAAEIAKDKARMLGSWISYASGNLRHWDNVIQGVLVFIPDTIGLMLIGMAGYKSGFLTGAWSDASYRRFASWTIPLGIAAGIGVVAIDLSTNFYTIAMMGSFVVLETPFITLMALGYAALIILLTRRGGWLAERIAAAGRCAFTNYLGTSIIASLVFFGWGLGLYGSLSRWQAWLVAPMIWTVMLLWSKPWLERFHYGPFEWAWRSLARGKLQPMWKHGAATVAAAA
ncbi:DUF418 domain-containing protein [Sphingomonas alba]|uniref:DUF418 domain-containing protein n=1 Tax=Sphingomonas alba TaxID=2908208 RepID=A0ABT0RL39_9SPHN|nr:DUF418 domain-containing protein [Sphingomonas alba]MCL6683367.1 DUF418 domain-containing protein [Sphingomonas alba]